MKIRIEILDYIRLVKKKKSNNKGTSKFLIIFQITNRFRRKLSNVSIGKTFTTPSTDYYFRIKIMFYLRKSISPDSYRVKINKSRVKYQNVK